MLSSFRTSCNPCCGLHSTLLSAPDRLFVCVCSRFFGTHFQPAGTLDTRANGAHYTLSHLYAPALDHCASVCLRKPRIVLAVDYRAEPCFIGFRNYLLLITRHICMELIIITYSLPDPPPWASRIPENGTLSPELLSLASLGFPSSLSVLA